MSSAIGRSMVDGEGSERRVRLETWWGIIDGWAKNRDEPGAGRAVFCYVEEEVQPRP